MEKRNRTSLENTQGTFKSKNIARSSAKFCSGADFAGYCVPSTRSLDSRDLSRWTFPHRTQFDALALPAVISSKSFLFCWMPNSSSSCPTEQEATQSSNSSASAPLSPQTRRVDRDVDPNAMLVVAMMASGTDRTRLVTSRSRDDGQSETEHKNDIISQSNNTTTSNGAVGKKSVKVVLLPPSNPPRQLNLPVLLGSTKADESAAVADSRSLSNLDNIILPSTESSTSTSRTNQRNNHQLSAELVQASIHAALASMRGKQAELLETSDSEKETGDEEMHLNKNVVSKKPRRKRTPQAKAGQTSGRWTQQEHQAFLEGLRECGREWKKVAMRIPTRTSAQIRSHAQKYFSKIQRDHENSFLPESAVSGCATATVSSTDNQHLPPSIQRNVERILANPVAVQQEVEHTLEALRERYRQLQLRLEQRQRQRTARRDLSRETNYRHCVPNDESETSSLLPSKKRSLADTHVRPRLASSSSNSHDDLSSVSSNVSASVASMGHDELIALHVLQGALPRGESSQELERMVAHSLNSSDASVDSSSAAAPHEDQAMQQENENGNHSDCSHRMQEEDPTPKRPKSN